MSAIDARFADFLRFRFHFVISIFSYCFRYATPFSLIIIFFRRHYRDIIAIIFAIIFA